MALAGLLNVALAGVLAGCGQRVTNGALDLYHGLQGGPIADQRPPPPGVDEPYPLLGTTPKRPPATDVAAQQRIGDTLAAQRDAAASAAAQDPLRALPKPPDVPKPPPPDPNANKVVVDAAPAPPPDPAPAPAPAPPSALASVPPLAAPVDGGALPELALAPPPAPVGIEQPGPPPAPSQPITAAAPAPVARGVTVAFTPGSAVLPPSATLTLRRFALAHRGAALAVTGHGDAGARDAEAQSRAMELALKRAGAIAASLGTAGVAANRLHLRADTAAAGSTATLN